MDIIFTQRLLEPSIYTFSFGRHKDKPVIWIHFPFSIQNKNNLKAKVKAKWSQSQKTWYVLDTNHYREKFNLPMRIVGKKILSKIHPNNQLAFDSLVNILKMKAYSSLDC